MLLAAAVLTAAWAGLTFAQQSRPPRPGTYYDTYEPDKRLRLRRESCMSGEMTVGAYCAKACRKGYGFVSGSKLPKCRSLEPIPVGQAPLPTRKDIGVQPLLPRERATPRPNSPKY